MEGEERTDLEFEEREEKEKHKVKGKKDELDTTSSVVEVCGDEMGKVFEGENCDKNGGGTHMNSGEGANRKKKRKRKKEGGDIVMNNVIDEKELIDDRDKSSGKTKEEADFAGNLKMTNRILEDDDMSVAAGCEDAAKVNNEAAAKVNNEAGDMKRKKEKEQRENVGGELVQNIKTNGMEPGVETQSLDGNIVQKDGFALNESKKEKRNGGKNQGRELLDTVAEKLGTESSEVQENLFIENGGNVQSTADESCNIDLEGGELVQNIKTNGMEPEVETQSLDGNIVQKDGFALNESKIEKRNGGQNSGRKLLDTVVEKPGTESSEVQESIFLENGGNVQPTADEICNRDLEAVVVDDGKERKKKKKKTKSEKHVNVKDSNRDLEVVNVEDGEKNKKKAKLEEQVNVEDSNRDLEAVNVEDGEKRKKKAKSEEHVNVEGSGRDMEAVDVEDGKLRKKAKSEKHVNVEELNRDMEVVNVDDGEKRKKKKKAKLEEHANVEYSNRDLEAVNVEDGKKRKKKKAKLEEHANVEDSDRDMEAVDVEDGEKRKKKKKAKSEEHANVEDCDRDMEAVDVADGKLRKKKAKSEKHVNVEDSNREMEVVDVEDGSKRKKKAKAEKRVNVEDCNANTEAVIIEDREKKQNASDEVVFSPSDGPIDEHEGLVRGKRFSEEEDKILREAVLQYIEEQDLGVDGLNMVLHCRSHPKVKDHPEVRNCWKVIGEAIPWRPFKSVYYRAHILFERAEERTWTPEEYEAVRKFYKDYGADWRTLGDKLGKHRIHVKDAWRRLKLPNHKKGPWSQEEYQTLFDLVNMDLRMKASEEKKTKHGMLRDNICWEAISEKLGTRSNSICSMKWYNQLASPLVNQKLWADIDDYRLLNALNSLQASCIEDVDWDDLLEHRPGEVCQKRWDQMIKHIGQHALKSFPDQVEVLFKRYPADIMEAIEVYDSKPVID